VEKAVEFRAEENLEYFDEFQIYDGNLRGFGLILLTEENGCVSAYCFNCCSLISHLQGCLVARTC
jgi:hypothetical protein